LVFSHFVASKPRILHNHPYVHRKGSVKVSLEIGETRDCYFRDRISLGMFLGVLFQFVFCRISDI
jgi:hypothetical protein